MALLYPHTIVGLNIYLFNYLSFYYELYHLGQLGTGEHTQKANPV